MLLTALRRLKGSLAQVQEIQEKSYEGDTSPELRQKIEVDLEESASRLAGRRVGVGPTVRAPSGRSDPYVVPEVGSRMAHFVANRCHTPTTGTGRVSDARMSSGTGSGRDF
jgi:hypothetical protein